MKTRINRMLAILLAAVIAAGCVLCVGATSGSKGYDLLIMSNNVLFDDTHDTKYRMHCLAQTYLDYMPDVLCLQEARANQTAQLYPLLEADYSVVPLEQYATDGQKIVYQQLLYRTELYTVVEAGFERFRENVYPWGVSWAVFERKEDSARFCVMDTHLSIISSTYDPGASNTVEGVQLRQNDCNTIVSAAESVRDKYPGIPILVGGDWNEIHNSPSLRPIDEAALLTNVMAVSPVANTTVNTTHELCRMPAKGGDIIDHFYVTTDALAVSEQGVVADGIVIQGSDHCPIYVMVSFQ